jgi:hypothetical protein
VLYGKDSVFININSQSLAAHNVTLFTAQNAKFIGGLIRRINLQVSSAETLLMGVATSDHAMLGIVGPGTHKRVGCIKFNVDYVKSGSYTDIN